MAGNADLHITAIPGFVLRDLWIESKITDEEYLEEVARRKTVQAEEAARLKTLEAVNRVLRGRLSLLGAMAGNIEHAMKQDGAAHIDYKHELTSLVRTITSILNNPV